MKRIRPPFSQEDGGFCLEHVLCTSTRETYRVEGEGVMNRLRVFIIIATVGLLLAPGFAFSYGNGGDGGSGDVSQADSFGGGAVSWSPNPNGVDVRGSSIWNGRPANIEKGPYQEGTAVEDAEQDLLDGYRDKTYSADEVKANLEWAQNAGIQLSDAAQKTLDAIKNPPPTQHGKWTEKMQDKSVKVINFVNDIYKLRDKRKSQGLSMTADDYRSAGVKSGIKNNVPPQYRKYVDKAFDFAGF